MPDIAKIIEELKEIFASFEFIESIDTYSEIKIYINPKYDGYILEETVAERRKIISAKIKDVKKWHPTINFHFIEKWPEIREIF